MAPLRILVVDDSALICNAMRQTLEEADCRVETAGTGEEGLEAARRFHPDVVVCDMDMPGMSGLEVVRAMKNLSPSTPVLILTVADDVSLAVNAMREGAYSYLVKGESTPRLLTELEWAVSHRRLLERAQKLEEENRRYRQELERRVEEKTGEVIRLRDLKAQAEKLAAMGTLVAGVAHEVNSPLAVVLSNLSWLEEILGPWVEWVQGREANEELAEVPQVLRESAHCAKRIARIVEGLRRLAHPGARGARCEVKAALEEVRLLCRGRLAGPTELSFEIDPVVRQACISQDDLVSALCNLVTNSAHALIGRDDPRVEVRVSAGEEVVIFEVRDNGCGIPQEALNKVCDPFFTTKQPGQGTGLGLSLVEQMVRAAGGQLSIESEVELGTRVRMELPAGESQTQAQGATREQSAA